MGFSEGVQWWEDWQLRFLVLFSLYIQYFLFFAAILRKRRIPHWFRFLIWLAYLGCDAVVIYALATLFNLHKKDEVAMDSAHLDALWAPILLIHLGGQDGITAYSIEDNENWRRHLLISVSQITVAIYVFHKSWWSDDRRLLRAAIVLFVPGILKCLAKPWTLKNATITSIMSFPDSRLEQTLEKEDMGRKDILSLDKFVENAAKSVQDAVPKDNKDAQDMRKKTPIADDGGEAKDKHEQEEELGAADHMKDAQEDSTHTLITNAEDRNGRYVQLQEALVTVRDLKKKVGDKPYHLFADLGHPYFVRLKNLQEVTAPHGAREATHGLIRSSLSKAFDRLYTKHKRRTLAGLLRAAAVLLPFAVIGLFHGSHRSMYSHDDVMVTYVLLCGTAALELVSTFFFLGCGLPQLDDQITQYNLIGYLARNKSYQSFWSLVSWLGCKDQLDRVWCTEPPEPSAGITKLVYDHVVRGWTKYMDQATYEPIMFRDEDYDWDWHYTITAVGAYRRFNDSRGQRTLELEIRCQQMEAVRSSMHLPFDESVLLWHLATEFCYYEHVDTGSDITRHSRVMSNYMAYLLFVNPEMLVPGARRSLFMAAYRELEPLGYAVVEQGTMPESPPKTRDEMARKIIQKVKSTIGSDDLVHRAWELAHELMELARHVAEEEKKKKEADRKKKQEEINKGKEENLTEEQMKAKEVEKKMDKMKEKKLMIEANKAGDDKMWAVIQGVWVEMLCFSAGRCRGYMHAKSIGKGGEYLSYVWLLLNYMGMETMPEKMQRPDLPVEGDAGGLVKSISDEIVVIPAKEKEGEDKIPDALKKKKEQRKKKEQEHSTKPAQAAPSAATMASALAKRTEKAEQGGPEELTEMENEPKGDTEQAQTTTSTQATTSAAAVVTIIGDENV
ncbi:hypothetical protein HU200_054137 [Digitaria exilis]|uniref:DUF4220 domain-containing protein n=1 Tax=Digitaria exilis TaxID=1010633 RepID=A0A835E794_9POAL|nr:hypothetical protein HU200_054137 [Digitaria exilis]